MASLKSNESSNEFRAKGNKFYSARKFFEALINYNQSLSFAEAGTENLGLAYANKSAVYFEMKIYDHSLKNIELAKQNHYPEKNFEILNKREEKCKELEKSQAKKTPWNFFKLSYPANKKTPFIVDCLEVKFNEKFGRHVITNRALKVGDVVSVEDPYCGVLLSESNMLKIPDANIFQRCSYCLKENALDLIPCLNCCKGS
jgi:SET and MYND domain-containing protein 4